GRKPYNLAEPLVHGPDVPVVDPGLELGVGAQGQGQCLVQGLICKASFLLLLTLVCLFSPRQCVESFPFFPLFRSLKLRKLTNQLLAHTLADIVINRLQILVGRWALAPLPASASEVISHGQPPSVPISPPGL